MSSTRSSARSSSRLARRSANGSSTLMRAATTLWRLGSATALALACAAMPLQAQAQMPAPAAAQAGGNAIESVTAHQQGSNVIGKNTEDMNLGELRSVNLVQAGERLRLVFNLKRSLNYATAIDGNAVILTIDGSGGLAQAVDGNGLPAAVAAAPAAPAVAAAPPGAGPSAAAGRPLLRDMDFRRGSAGEGRIVVDLPNSQVAVDVRQTGTGVVVDFLNTGLPETLRRRLDVTDFGTPVALITTSPQGQNVRMNIEARGLWEQSVYQSETQLVIDIKPIKEDPNKLTQGTQGYRGEKLSFNFQNVEVRAALQAIADISGLNIITSDSVSGNLTLRLKEVPWDQALDVVLQAKGLDMRKNGNVLLIAPKEELLSKEK